MTLAAPLGWREDVVEADDAVLHHDLAAAQQLPLRALQNITLIFDGGVMHALRVGGNGMRAGAAQFADDARVVRCVHMPERWPVRQAIQRGPDQHLCGVELEPAQVRQALVKIRWLAVGRDADDQRQAGRGKGMAAAGDQIGQGQRAGGQRVDAARALGLAR